MEPIIITHRVEPVIITTQGGTRLITTRATRLASREEEAALRKHGREGFLLRSRACAGLLFANTPYIHLVPVLPENPEPSLEL